MAFVRKKQVGRYEYYQLVENHRVEGKPRQRVLLYLGAQYPTVDTALEEWPKAIERLRRYAQREREKAGYPSEEPSSRARNSAPSETAEKAERRADKLAANLKRLEDLRAQGVV